MSKLQRTYKGGSIVNFVIIGVILSVLLIGGVYLIKQRGEQVRKEQAIADYEDQKKSEQKADNESEESKETETDEVTDDESTDGSTKESTELPQTGAGNNLAKSVALFLMTFMSVSIVGSFRKSKSYL